MRSRALQVVAVVLTIAFGGSIRAEERPRVVVLDDGQASLAERMRAELVTMGFDAVKVSLPPGSGSFAQLDAITREHQAVAAIRLVTEGESAQALLFDRTTGKTVSRRLDGGADQAALGLRSVELLRASLLELALPDAPRGDIAPSPQLLGAAGVPKPSPALPRRPVAAVEVGLGALGSTGGLPIAPALSVSISALATRVLRVGAFGLIPLNAMKHDATEGHSDTRVLLLGSDLRYELQRRSWLAQFGAGVSLTILSTEGRGSGGLYAANSATRASAGTYLRVGVGYELTRGFAVRLDAAGGMLAHPFAIDYAGREAARWGSLWLAGWLTMESRIP